MSIFDSSPVLKRLSDSATNEDTLRVMVFAVANYYFALPVGAILKVSICPPITTTVERGIGMVDLGSQTIAAIDLRYKLHSSPQPLELLEDPTDIRRFLILFQTKSGEPCGIITLRPPVLRDLALSCIRPVPLPYRQVAALNFASHVALASEGPGNKSLEIFLLGTNQMLNRNSR